MVILIRKTYTIDMRLFYALTFDESTLSLLCNVQNTIQRVLTKGRKSAKDNLHLTLSFLGEQESLLLPLFADLLNALPNTPLSVQFTHLGTFTKPGGSIIWFGIERNQKILSLQSTLVEQLRMHNITFSDTPFAAHVTLFRNAQLIRLPSVQHFPCNISSISLMHSHQENGVLTYTPLATNILSGN